MFPNNHRTIAPRELENEVGDLFSGLLRGGRPRPMNISEKDAAYEVEIEIPGVSMDTIEIEFEGKSLSVRVKEDEPETAVSDENLVWHRRDRRGARMEETLRFPREIAVANIEARLEMGVLFIRLPKVVEAQKRRITISK